MYALRPFTSEDKMKSMKELIKDFQPDIVFIDGIVDIMCNFNDVEESKKVIDELMRMSTKEESGKNLSIVCVLHTNKATEDHNMRGHLGTMLTQKAGTVLEVTKNKNGIFTVSNTESRNKEVPDWSFCFDNNGDIVDTTEMVKQMTKEQEMKREAEKKAKSEAKTQDVTLNCDQTGFGVTPIIGIDWKINDQWNLAAKYEFKTRIRLKNEAANSANFSKAASRWNGFWKKSTAPLSRPWICWRRSSSSAPPVQKTDPISIHNKEDPYERTSQ